MIIVNFFVNIAEAQTISQQEELESIFKATPRWPILHIHHAAVSAAGADAGAAAAPATVASPTFGP